VKRSTSAEARRLAVLEKAHDLGEVWALAIRAEIRDEQRLLAGGWPGTLSEARARAFAHFSSAASVTDLGTLDAPELEVASREVYARARQVWLAGASNDVET
jgi:hypothetical protein